MDHGAKLPKRPAAAAAATPAPSRRDAAIAAYNASVQAIRSEADAAKLELQNRPEALKRKQELEDAAREWVASMGFGIFYLLTSWHDTWECYTHATVGIGRFATDRFNIQFDKDGSVTAYMLEDPYRCRIQNEVDYGAALVRAENHRTRFDDYY